MRIDDTHDPARLSWVESANGHSDFPIQNLPLCIFSSEGRERVTGVAIGDFLIDLPAIAEALGDAWVEELAQPVLNAFLALGTGPRVALRQRLSHLLSDEAFRDAVDPALIGQSEATMHLPTIIGDYTDFYVGIHHATNVGRQFRPDNPLLPNYKYVPIGYHGRASSVRVSGQPVVRPSGQRKPPEADAPVFGPSRRLDYELELGVWIGPGNALGEAIPIDQAEDAIAGYCLLNDWSARDLQAWEYQPLGPFLAKNFLTSVSPFLVTPEAMAPFMVDAFVRPDGDPEPLPYLNGGSARPGLGLTVSAALTTQKMREGGMAPRRLSEGRASDAMYWTVEQIIAHHSCNGCNLQPGDLIGTGTLSTASSDGLGSLLEISKGGREPLTLPTGETRSFLEDGDELVITARAEAEGFVSIGLGECRGLVVG
ncbi:fumarylacetoacetase [Sphingomonas glaciei]|uniref:fumarylacetoacetase n=1 Tax=Sphingomonas glaciei TaxID=2938948 RepID=A0ABY5MSS4_9SPHN|nr:fumarylacetoacetase [Sphingomonas glaciei]UUR07467.1 fumarylacetoacetase [Sphingomonas glaciei]